MQKSITGKFWCLRASNERLTLAISQRFGLLELVARSIAGRGIDLDKINSFLEDIYDCSLKNVEYFMLRSWLAYMLKNGISSRSKIPISVDTRKSDVASAARKAGASMVNDVSGFTFDPNLLFYCSKYKLPVCVMHMQGSPEYMQNNPKYEK